MLRDSRKPDTSLSEANSFLPFLLDQIGRSGLIRCPLVMVSQISRSGGTLVSQLFDHHPQIWAHPRELKIGYPRKWDWPDLSGVTDPQDAWTILRDRKADMRLGTGQYYKGNMNETLPILFSASTQEQLFLELASRHSPVTGRDWLDLYFTSFFYAWLDYQRRYGQKLYVTGFASMLALAPTSMVRFREAYPEGWLISVAREPLGWYASVKQHSINSQKEGRRKRHYAGAEEAETAYLQNIQAMHDNRARFGPKFVLLDFDRLVSETEATMRTLAQRLGLDWHPILACQTFNGMPIQPNTSFRGEAQDKRATVLSKEELIRVREGPMMAAYRSILPDSGGP